MTSSENDADIWDYKASGEGETVDVVADDPNAKPKLNMEYHTERLSDAQLEAFNELLDSWGGVVNPDKASEEYLKDYAEDHDWSWYTYKRALNGAVPSIRSFDDLTLAIKLAIVICAHEDGVDSSPNGLAERDEYPLSDKPYHEAMKLYPDLIGEKEPATQAEVEKWMDKYRKKRPSSFANDSGSSGYTKNESGYTVIQERLLEAISDNPSANPTEIHEIVDIEYAPTYYHNVVQNNANELEKRIREKGTVESKDDMYGYLAKRIDLDDVMGASNEDISEMEERLATLENRVGELEAMQDGDSPDTDIAEQILDRLSEDRLEKLLVESL